MQQLEQAEQEQELEIKQRGRVVVAEDYKWDEKSGGRGRGGEGGEGDGGEG